jgi:hypothetical protein
VRADTEEQALRRRNAADWRGRADMLATAVSRFLTVDTMATMMPRDREVHDRRALLKTALQVALTDYLRTD